MCHPPFKNPSKLKVVHQKNISEPPLLKDTKTGDMFIRSGAICMRVELCHEANREENERLARGCVPIINLQTGRVWCAEGDDQIVIISATLTYTANEA